MTPVGCAVLAGVRRARGGRGFSLPTGDGAAFGSGGEAAPQVKRAGNGQGGAREWSAVLALPGGCVCHGHPAPQLRWVPVPGHVRVTHGP